MDMQAIFCHSGSRTARLLGEPFRPTGLGHPEADQVRTLSRSGPGPHNMALPQQNQRLAAGHRLVPSAGNRSAAYPWRTQQEIGAKTKECSVKWAFQEWAPASADPQIACLPADWQRVFPRQKARNKGRQHDPGLPVTRLRQSGCVVGSIPGSGGSQHGFAFTGEAMSTPPPTQRFSLLGVAR